MDQPQGTDRPRGRRLGPLTRERLDAELTRLPRDITSSVIAHMLANNISRADLAEAIGVSASRVSQILSGDENLTLRTIATVAAALDCRLDAQLVPSREPAATQSTEGIRLH